MVKDILCALEVSLSYTLGQKSSIYPKIHNLKSQFTHNSHFQNLIFDKIHNFKISFFTKFTISKSHFFTNFTFSQSHFSQNSHFSSIKFLAISRKKSWFQPQCELESLRNFWAQKEALFALIRKNKQLASFQFLLTKSIEQILSKESI